MKNIALLSVAALVILLIGTLIHYENTSYDVIFTANVEALSDAEHGEYVKCWKSIRDDISDVVLYCVKYVVFLLFHVKHYSIIPI